jgi:hypothetical protein
VHFEFDFLPLSRAEHRHCERNKRVGLFERSAFRRAPFEKPNNETSIMPSGKAQGKARRRAID